MYGQIPLMKRTHVQRTVHPVTNESSSVDTGTTSLDRTLVIIKPDGVRRSLVGEVIRRRGDFARTRLRTVVHASDTPAAAEEEIRRWFLPQELAIASTSLAMFTRPACTCKKDRHAA